MNILAYDQTPAKLISAYWQYNANMLNKDGEYDKYYTCLTYTCLNYHQYAYDAIYLNVALCLNAVLQTLNLVSTAMIRKIGVDLRLPGGWNINPPYVL